jgi:preprotein translocase subunit SecG
MTTFLIIIHIIASFLLIGAVLLQSGKGAEIGVSFGSAASQTLFGSRGPGSFLSKVTVVVAAFFMLSALGLAALAQRGGSSSVVVPPKQETQAPAPRAPQLPIQGAPQAPPAPANPAK